MKRMMKFPQQVILIIHAINFVYAATATSQPFAPPSQVEKSFSIFQSHHVVIISTTDNYCDREWY